VTNGFGRVNTSLDAEPARSRRSAGRLLRCLPILGLVATAFLVSAHRAASQEDLRDSDGLRRREIPRDRRLVAEDDRRPDPRAIERRTRLYQELTRDFQNFDKNGFDRSPERRFYRTGPAPAIVESAEMLDGVRRSVDQLAHEADALQAALTNDVDIIRGLRGVLPEVIQFSANAQVLRDRCLREGQVAGLCGDFEAVDRDWQAISYKLRRIPELMQTAAIRRIDVMDKLDRQLSDAFKIQPQFNQRELLHESAVLSDRLQRLAEDVGLELVDPEQRRALTDGARRAQSEAQMVCDALDSGNDPAAVLGEFQEYLQLWHPLARQIRQFDVNRSLERSVMRISKANRKVAELLRAPMQNDTSNLGYMTEGLKHDIDEYFTRVPLKLLMELPESRTALVTAGEFYGDCEQFQQDASGNASQADLAESFHRVAEAWRAFDHSFRPMNSESARRVLNRIEDGVNSIADALQLYDRQFDRRKISEYAYTLLAAADNINRDTRIWLARDRDVDFADDAIRATDEFVKHCRRFGDAVSGNGTVDQLRQEIVSLYEHYKRVYDYISQCRGPERGRLGENAYRTKNALVDLRTLLEI